MQDETHPEQQEPEPELQETEPEKHEPESEQQEPEPEKRSELEILRAKDIQLRRDLRKAHMNLLATFEKLKKVILHAALIINTVIM